MGTIAIRLAYGVMIVGIILCFVFTRNRQRGLREAANDFAFVFVKLSNYISSRPPKAELLTEALPDGRLRALPVERQPEAIQTIIRRAGSAKSVKLFAQLSSAAETVASRANINRTDKAQFVAPIDELLLLAHTFLVGCENLETIDTPEKKAAFDSFLMEQPKHRMMLLKRITGDAADKYRELNKQYAQEMEQMEAEERKRGHKRGTDQGTDQASPGETDPVSGTKAGERDAGEDSGAEGQPEASSGEASAEEKASDETSSKKEDPEKESLRDKWRGWGCC